MPSRGWIWTSPPPSARFTFESPALIGAHVVVPPAESCEVLERRRPAVYERQHPVVALEMFGYLATRHTALGVSSGERGVHVRVYGAPGSCEAQHVRTLGDENGHVTLAEKFPSGRDGHLADARNAAGLAVFRVAAPQGGSIDGHVHVG